MKKADKQFNELFNQVEGFLNTLNPKDKRYYAIQLCTTIAGEATFDDIEEPLDAFKSLEILDEAKKELTNLIDREILDCIGEELVRCAKGGEDKEKSE